MCYVLVYTVCRADFLYTLYTGLRFKPQSKPKPQRRDIYKTVGTIALLTLNIFLGPRARTHTHSYIYTQDVCIGCLCNVCLLSICIYKYIFHVPCIVVNNYLCFLLWRRASVEQCGSGRREAVVVGSAHELNLQVCVCVCAYGAKQHTTTTTIFHQHHRHRIQPLCDLASRETTFCVHHHQRLCGYMGWLRWYSRTPQYYD